MAPDFNSEKKNSEEEKFGVGDQNFKINSEKRNSEDDKFGVEDQDISTDKVSDGENLRSYRYNLRSRVANTAVS